MLDGGVETTSGSVSNSTMHRAKGLEFRTAAVTACDDGVIPLDEYVTVVQAVQRTGYSPQQIEHLPKANQVRGTMPGGDWFVYLPSLIEQKHTVRPGRKPTRKGAAPEETGALRVSNEFDRRSVR